jgi:hypothetical protein
VLGLLCRAFQTLALGHCLLEPPRGLRADRDVLHREEDALDRIEAAGVQQQRARANPLEGGLNLAKGVFPAK